MLYLLVEVSSISPSPGRQPGVDTLGTTLHRRRSASSPLPAQPPCRSFTLEELNEGVSSILTNLFSYTSRSARVQGAASRVRKALDKGDLALLSIKRQPRRRRRFPLVREPSRRPGTRHLPAADSPERDAGTRACRALGRATTGLVLGSRGAGRTRLCASPRCHGRSACRLLRRGEPRHHRDGPELGGK